MPGWAKVLLGIFGGFILLMIAAGAGVFWYVHHNRARLLASGRQLRADGQSYGRGRDANACIDESLRRGEQGFMEGIRARVFLSGCLSTATVPPELCASTPPRSEIIRSATWVVKECERRGHPGQPCTNLMQAVQEQCEKVRSGG